MNLQQIMQVVVCAALIALGIAGAGLLPTQPVAGQKTEPVTLHGEAALDQLKQTGQYESLQAALNQARFRVSRAEQTPLGRAAWRAPNPSAGYDAYVTETGVSIIAKGAVNQQSFVSLSLHSLGYGAALRAVGPGEVSGDKQSISIERDGLREWFVNSPEGMEHGFTLSQRPEGKQADALLRLALQVGAGWRAVAGDGQRVSLHGPDNQIIEYGKLAVRDDAGRGIPARLAVADEQVVIEVEDGDAAYPLTIDPLFTLQQRLTAADAAAFDFFGYAVALDGDTALVGAPYDEVTHTDQGSVYVFVRDGAAQTTTWTFQQKLIASDGQPGDKFGSAVAVAGNTALVGMPEDDEGTQTETGSAYVFVRNGTTWTLQQKLTASGGFAGALFGAAVALDGDTALVGAHQQTITPSFAVSGAAYVFVRSGTNWTQQQRLLSNDIEDGDSFGFSVALDGDTALVGAPNNAVTVGNQGAAYIFTRNGTAQGATWTQQPRLTDNNPRADDQFGRAVALSGDRALIGAPLYNHPTVTDAGAVVDFRRGTAGWAQNSRFYAPNPTSGAHFGVALALDGDLAVVGASLGLPVLGVDQRSAYVFVGFNDYELIRQFGPELGAANDRFGYAVALDGDTVLVGAYQSQVTVPGQGAAYAFVLRDGRQVEQQKVFANDGVEDDSFGNAVTLDGDTLAVGASFADVGTKVDQGAVYVFTRNGTSWTFQQKLTANDGAAGEYFGKALALRENLLAVGAPYKKIGAAAAQGAVYLFTRNGTAWTQQPVLLANDGAADDFFGGALAFDGGTLAVGAIGANADKGALYVYTPFGSGLVLQQKLTANDGAPGDNFGNAVALDGNTLAVGAVADSTGTVVGHGSAYVFTRNGTVWTQAPKIIALDGAELDYFGHALALHGDTLVVSALADNVGMNPDQGSAYVFGRAGTSWSFRQQVLAPDGVARAFFGSAVALSGDTLVVGAEGDLIGTKSNQGSAYVFTRLGGWTFQQKLTASDGTADDFFGSAVALSGATIAVGARADNIGTTVNQGSAYVFAAPACPTFTLQPANLPNGAVGTNYDQQLSTGVPPQVEEFQFSLASGALPPGLTLDYGGGRLSGTPTAAGTYRFTIKTSSTRSRCPGYRSYTVTILLSCPAITVNPAMLPVGTAGAGYSQSLSATGGAAPYTFSLTSGSVLPPGLLLSGGTLAGTPTQHGVFNFTVRAADANGCTGERAYTLTINAPPAISPIAVSQQAGSPAASKVIANVSDANQAAGTLTVTVNGGASATVSGITLSSISINAAGAVSASVVAACGAANAAFTLTVTDNASAAANATLNVTVTANSPPALNYALQSVAVTGGLTINPASGPSDNGAIASIAVQSPGTFTGTLAVNPTTGVVTVSNAKPVGTHSITIRATDNCGATQDALLRLEVTCPAITLNPPALPGADVGVSYNQTLTASGGTPGYSFSVNPSELPNGLTLSANGTLSGTPTSGYGGGFTVTATDANGCRGTRSYSFTVNAPPTITALSGNARQGSPASRLAIASVQDNQFTDTLGYTINGGASATVNGVTVSNLSATRFNVLSADVVATCAAVNASFTLTVTDDFGLTANATLNISVTANSLPVLSYGNQSLAAGGALTINPASGPSDNGSVASIAVQSLGTFTGPLSVNNTTGVINVSNAQPAGSHTITIRATDNCGATRDATFTLSVNCPAITLDPAPAGGVLPGGTTGVSYQQTITATGGVAPHQFSVSAGALPAGLSLSTGGALTGTPGASGAFNFTVKATDANGCAGTRAYALTVVCPGITVNPATLPNGTTGVAYSQTLTGAGGTAPYSFTLDGGSLPSGVTLAANGGLTGTPGASGAFNFTAKATDANGCTGTRAYTLTVVCPSITVNPASLPNGTTGTAYNQTLTAVNGIAPHTFAVSNGSLPAGLTLAAAGALSGTPTASGNFNFTVTATDANGCTGSRAYTLAIIAGCPTIMVNPANATLPVGQAGQQYNQTFTQTGGNGAAAFTISAGALPNGLSLSAAGVLSGSPTAFGNFNFTVKATDANGCLGTRAYSLTINPPCATITVNPSSLPNGTAGTTYSQTASATGGAAPYTYTISAGTLPGGLNLASGGALTGTPNAAGVFNFTVKATDANGCMGTRAYTVTIIQAGGGGNSGLQFYPLPKPLRLLDTRAGFTGCDAPGAQISGNTSRTQLARRSCDGITIPASAMAVTGNITTVQSDGGYLTLYPSDAAQPLVANSNYAANEIINNVFTVGLGNADGSFKIFVTSNTHVVVDVTGYYAPPAAGGLYFHPLPKPIRLLETRPGFNGAFTPGVKLQANADTPQPSHVTYDGVTIPATAQALAGNATTINGGAGFMTLSPGGVPRPLAASSNFSAGQVMNAPFTVGLSAAGEFNIFTTTTTDVIIDVLGYYSTDAMDANGAGLLFNPLPAPVRLLETRAGFTGCYTPNAPLATGSIRQQQARGACGGQTIANNALAIVGNATVINNQAGYLTFSPDGAAQPLVASSNFAAGQILNRHFTVGLGGNGMFNIFASAQTDLIVDVSGFFAP